MLILSHNISFGPNLDRWRYCDVGLTTEDSKSSIPVHRNILAQVSPVLKYLFDRNSDNNNTLSVQKVNFEALGKIIELLYEGKVMIYNDAEINVINVIKQLQMNIKINKDVTVDGNSRPCKNGYHETNLVLKEEMEEQPSKNKCKQNCLISYENSRQSSLTCKKSSHQESQENVFIKCLPIPVPATLSLVSPDASNVKTRKRPTFYSKPISDESVRSKRIRVRMDIFKDLKAKDNVDDSGKERHSHNEAENKTLRITGVKHYIYVEDLMSYLDLFRSSVESLVQSISVSDGQGIVHFKNTMITEYFDQHVCELKGAKIKLFRPTNKPCV